MTFEQDREDLERHAGEIEARESFNYAVLDEAEERLLGCVYLVPPAGQDEGGYDVVVSWWLIDELSGTPTAAELDAFVPTWVTSAWPFSHPCFSP